MSGEIFFTTAEIAQQLSVGISTVKLWVKRYSPWLFTDIATGDAYPEETLETFRIISEYTASGMDMPTIENALTEREKIISETVEPAQTDTDTGMSVNATDASVDTGDDTSETPVVGGLNVSGLDTILLQILEQQKKIATAQERRATAEERKAFALESRTEAELLKANVMQELLTEFKSHSTQPTVTSLMERIKGMPGPEPGSSSPGLNYDFADNFSDLPELTESDVEDIKITPPTGDAPLDKQGEQQEIAKEKAEPQPPVSSDNDVSKPADGETSAVESVELPPQPPDDMDDLSLLIDDATTLSVDDSDDLSLLVGDAAKTPPDDMDDLSLLIDGIQGETTVAPDDMDDLALLIGDAPTGPPGDMDDLSLLLEDAGSKPDADMDDLSLLIGNTGEETPAKTDVPSAPDATVTQEKEKVPSAAEHKSMVLSKIIKLKEQEKLSVDETAKRLNDEGVKTLSGKGQWDTKTIAGIFKYIDSGKSKK